MDDSGSGVRWALEFTLVAEEDVARLDAAVRKRTLNKIKWLRDHFNDIVPQPLGGVYQGLFKLRTGDWRIVYEINAEKQLLTIHLIDRRYTVYKRLH